MENLSKRNIYVIETFLKGYDISKEGFLIRKDGSYKKDFRKNENGYYVTTLRLPSCHVAEVRIHKLQAYKKYGSKMFEEGIMVRHFNGNKEDNSYDNILIGNKSDNQMDIPEEIRIKSAIKAIRTKQDSMRSYEERCEIYSKIKNGISFNIIMSEHKISKSGLSYMKNRSKEYKEYILI